LRSLVRRPLASVFRRIFPNKRGGGDGRDRDDNGAPELIVAEIDGTGGTFEATQRDLDIDNDSGDDNDNPTALSASTSALSPLSSLLAPPSMPGPSSSPSSTPQVSSASSSSSPLGGVVGVMEQLEAFRTSQRIGAQTSQLLNDLQNHVQVDAYSYGNHVKVIMDGHQRVKSLEMDDQFLRTSEPYEISAAVLEALQLAHDKSTDKMDEKVKAFYAKLGLLGGGGGGGGGGGV
jgi:DNA-binding protein YbaB